MNDTSNGNIHHHPTFYRSGKETNRVDEYASDSNNGGKDRQPPGPPMDLEPRIRALELDVKEIKTTMQSLVTKADMHQEFSSLAWKIYTFGTLLVIVTFFIAKNVK